MPLTRRAFQSSLAAGLIARAADAPRPNILWITAEDIGPHLGCYGDKYAQTPTLDQLAARSLRYDCAWSNAPVCAPARTAIISGMYPTSTGSEHMRSVTRLPRGAKMYPQYLREAGYYTSNNSKEDYNLEKPGEVWHDSSPKAHWRQRASGQPFFSIFNFTITHESQIRRRPHTLVHDPAGVRVPAYHPDTPEVRHDWAQYYDNITTMDGQAARVLRQLEGDGLAGDTIVFFYGDHGSGMPRNKRWPYNSGLHVPLLVHIPEKFRHLAPPDYRPGGVTKRMVGFVDLAPTLLSLAGVKPPDHMQGTAFLGPHAGPESPFAYGFRGRMDERCDLVRSVRDSRYVYIRNYMPHRVYGQHINYMFQTPTTRVWHDLYTQGKLNAAQRRFWETKPPEELYDLEADRDEVNNLAASADHRQTLARLRQAQRDWVTRVRDVGFLPEGEIHARAADMSPYEMGRDEQRYPFRRILEIADLASGLESNSIAALRRKLDDSDSAVRYWAVSGLLMRGANAVATERTRLRRLLSEDSSPYVRCVAGEALGRYGSDEDLPAVLDTLLQLAPLDRHGIYVSMAALNALDLLGPKAAPLKARLRALPRTDPKVDARMAEYVPRLIEHIEAQLG